MKDVRSAVRRTDSRRGARSLCLVPKQVLARLNRGACESVNLMEWLATDMRALSDQIFQHHTLAPWGPHIRDRIPHLEGLGVTRRLCAIGAAIADSVEQVDHPALEILSKHQSDIVRQWAVYACNALNGIDLADRLRLTRRFAADPNMSVRECAWMAFRPHLAKELLRSLELLGTWVEDANAQVRRFAIEVTRPRSVWGAHIPALKVEPALASRLLHAVKSDSELYVRTAVGNWLHDAWKTSPAWVEATCVEWNRDASAATSWIIRRALRTKYKTESTTKSRSQKRSSSG